MEQQRRFGRVVLVLGPESLLAERAVERLVRDALAEVPDAALTRLDASGLDAGGLAEATGGSLFANSTVVVLENLAELPPELADHVLGFVTTRADDLALILVHPGGVKGKGLLDKLRKAGVEVVDCPAIKAWELPQFAASEARLAGARLDQPTAAALVEAIGPDVRAVAGAVRQLLADAPDGVVTEAVVRRYFAGRADATSFSVADHVLAGQRDLALGSLRWALETGVAPVLVTSALASALRSLGKFVDLRDPRRRDADVAREIGVPPWKIRDLSRQAGDWTPRGIAESIQAVARADAEVKGAAGDAGYSLERMVITVCGRRGRRPEQALRS